MSGSNRERELARILDAKGYQIMRAPSSGAATKRSLPDLLYAKDGIITAAEMKYTGENRAYYSKEEVEALREFADAFEARVRLIARFKQDTNYYAAMLTDAERTPENNYVVHTDLDLEVINP